MATGQFSVVKVTWNEVRAFDVNGHPNTHLQLHAALSQVYQKHKYLHSPSMWIMHLYLNHTQPLTRLCSVLSIHFENEWGVFKGAAWHSWKKNRKHFLHSLCFKVSKHSIVWTVLVVFARQQWNTDHLPKLIFLLALIDLYRLKNPSREKWA